jgi:hypothetical protein
MQQVFNTQLLSPNASSKVIKILKHKKMDNAPGLALCGRGFEICSTDIKIETVPARWSLSLRCSFFFFDNYFFVSIHNNTYT